MNPWRAFLATLAESPADQHRLQKARRSILVVSMRLLAIFALLPLVIGAYQSFQQGVWYIGLGYIVFYAIIVGLAFAIRRLPTGVAVALVLGISSVSSFFGLVRLGLSSQGVLMLAGCTVLAVTLLGVKPGLAFMVAYLAAIIATGALFLTGVRTLPARELLSSYQLLHWINAGLIYVLVASVAIILPAMVFRQLRRALHAEEGRRQELEQAISAKEKSQRRFADMVNMLPETIFETDATGRLVYSNPSGFAMFGFDEHALEAGKTVLDLLTPESIEQAMLALSARFKGEPVGLSEYTAQRSDGATFPVMIRTSPIMEGSQVKGIRGLVIDVSERHELEQRLKRAERLQALSTLAGGIAHDFNNTLTSINGQVELALYHTPETSSARGNLLTAIKHIDRAAGLTAQLLDFGRIEDSDIRPQDLHSVLDSTLDDFTQTNPDITITRRYATDMPPVPCDAHQLERVALNLLVNAAWAMDGCGTIAVQTGRIALGVKDAKPLGLAAGEYATCAIVDQGAGLSEEVAARLFEPFFTTKTRGQGTGLGLATASRILASHGGLLTATNHPGGGAKLTWYLPLASDGPLPPPGNG